MEVSKREDSEEDLGRGLCEGGCKLRRGSCWEGSLRLRGVPSWGGPWICCCAASSFSCGQFSMTTISAWGPGPSSGMFNRPSFRPVARFIRICRPGGMDWSS